MKYTLIFSILAFSLIGCASIDKKHFKAQQFFLKNKDKLAELCSAEFPSKTEYIKGDPVIERDTVYSDVPIYVDCPDGTKQECPKQKTIYEKITITDTLKTPNVHYEAKLNFTINELDAKNRFITIQLDKAQKDLKQSESESKRKDWIIGGLIFALAIGVVIIIKK